MQLRCWCWKASPAGCSPDGNRPSCVRESAAISWAQAWSRGLSAWNSDAPCVCPAVVSTKGHGGFSQFWRPDVKNEGASRPCPLSQILGLPAVLAW